MITPIPLRGAGLSDEVLDAQSAKSKVARLLDGSHRQRPTLASALMSGMTPANAQWLNSTANRCRMTPPRGCPPAQRWYGENIHAAN